MKIGEAGEAFFIFETEADVPEDLITSPLLEATNPDKPTATAEGGRFGSHQADDQSTADQGASQEPEYFDLNAPSPEDRSHSGPSTPTNSNSQPAPNALRQIAEAVRPANFLGTSVGLGKAAVTAVVEATKEAQQKFNDEVHAAANVADARRQSATLDSSAPHKAKGDEALPDFDTEASRPSDLVYAGGTLFPPFTE